MTKVCSRGIIFDGDNLAMVFSSRFGAYKFPGGRRESKESRVDTLVREVREETGLEVDRDSIIEYGMARRIHKGNEGMKYVQKNYYYLCQVCGSVSEPVLEPHERYAGYTLDFVEPADALEMNRRYLCRHAEETAV